MMNYLKIYTDGGARGNPGPAAYGVVIKNKKDKTILKKGKAIGKATNNQAEYLGLIAGLELVIENYPQVKKVDFFLDSTLVVNQMKKKFKVKAISIRPLWYQAQKLANKINGEISYHYIPRKKNYLADKMLNQALNENSDR